MSERGVKPKRIFSNGRYTFSGASLTTLGRAVWLNPLDTHNNVTGRVSGNKIRFKDPNNGKSIKWSYDYSWGNPDWGFLVLGDTSGSYYILFLGDQDIDWDTVQISYPGARHASGPDNSFVVSMGGVSVTLTQDASGTAPDHFAPCYLEGMLVDTPHGLTPIEKLSTGDDIYIIRSGLKEVETITWCGSSKIKVKTDKPNDLAGYPVRIKKDAIGDRIPFEDLIVTSEHCLMFNDKLVPVRMLVNNVSIQYDTNKDEYTIYHIKTKRHSIIDVNGVLTETLFDNNNGNWKFNNNRFISNYFNEIDSSFTSHACPIDTTRSFVEPIYQQLLERCGIEHPTVETNLREKSSNYNISLVTQDGKDIKPYRLSNDNVIFKLDSGTRIVEIKTDTARPCDVVGPFFDDRRYLGILVNEVSLYCPQSKDSLRIDFLNPNLKGWQDVESDIMRWTAGKAELVIPSENTALPFLLSLRVSQHCNNFAS